MASKRKASAMAAAAPEPAVDPADELMFLCLGGGNEVGRSCHIVQYKGKTVMVCYLLLPPHHPSPRAELLQLLPLTPTDGSIDVARRRPTPRL